MSLARAIRFVLYLVLVAFTLSVVGVVFTIVEHFFGSAGSLALIILAALWMAWSWSKGDPPPPYQPVGRSD